MISSVLDATLGSPQLRPLPQPTRVGSQRPRIESYPAYFSTAADDAIDIASLVGLELDDWQEYVLRGALGERMDGKWSAFRVGLVVPRQNGKNAILEARELAGLFLFGEQLIFHTAHQYRTAKNAMKSMMNRLKSCPDLLEQIDGYDGDPDNVPGFKIGNNAPGITLKSGAQIQYATRGKDSGRGFTGNLVILDEAYSLHLEEMAALVPTMAATSVLGNPQLWFTSSAGMEDSDLLASLRQSGKDGDTERLAYFEWSADEEASIDDRDAWYQSNPGLGIRISEEYVEDELDTLVAEREDEGEEDFKRERLGIWAKIGGESVIPQAKWKACRDEELIAALEVDDEADYPLSPIAFALDIPPGRDSATIAMAGYNLEGLPYLEIIDRRDGISWVPAALATLQDEWKPSKIIVDEGSAAGALKKKIRLAGVRTTSLNMRQYGQACGQVFDMITDGTMRHSGQSELDEAVSAARQLPMGDTLWKWTRRNVVTDISPLVASTLAWYGLSIRGLTEKKKRRAVVL